MAVLSIYNQQGEKSGERELPKFFSLPWNADLVHQVVTSQAANRRPTVAHAKGRGEVRGGGRKPWRQKGTGRARHGSIRSPIWKGGGVAHGPKKEEVFKKTVNKKMATKALAVVLSAKARDNECLMLEHIAFPEAKTKAAAKLFSRLAESASLRDLLGKKRRVLVALPAKDPLLERSLRNLPFVVLEEARNITALDAMNYKYIVLPEAALPVFEKRFQALASRNAPRNAR